MFDERSGHCEIKPLETEYGNCVRTLNKTGIIGILPETETLGVIGIDGKEYPVPTAEQVGNLFESNRELIARKGEQGFTQLQLTPFAMPLTTLIDRVKSVILNHHQKGTIFQTKRNPTDPDVPIEVDPNQPVWKWDGLDDSAGLVYFPEAYDREEHHGVEKLTLIKKHDVCPIRGWSVGLIEDFSILPQEGQGQTKGGRKQLETNHTPIDYLATLKGAQYKGETGWTPEDLLVNFVSRLARANQVSHDWDDNSGLWLLGTYQKNEAYVPGADWNRNYRQLYLRRNYAGYRYRNWGARSTVRLS